MSVPDPPTIRSWGRLLALVAACAVGLPAALAQESASYVMDRVTVGSTADIASSAGFDMAVTFGQEGPVGSVSVCNAGAFQSTGFWSIAGDPPAPIFLDVVHDTIDPSAVLLTWTGSAQSFEVFRGEVASSVPVPANSLLTTPLCLQTDAPPAGFLYYYMVLSAGN